MSSEFFLQGASYGTLFAHLLITASGLPNKKQKTANNFLYGKKRETDRAN